MIVLTLSDVQKAVNRCASTIYDWIAQGRLPAPELNPRTGRAMGWTMEQLVDDSAPWLPFARKPTRARLSKQTEFWHKAAILKAAEKQASKKTTQKAKRTKRASSANITRKAERNGYRVNCGFNRPAYASELDKITQTIPRVLNSMKQPLGVSVTVRGHKDIPSTVRALKSCLAREFGLNHSQVSHISNREVSKKHGEHAHVCLMLDTASSGRTPKKRVLDVIDKFSDVVFVDHSRKSNRKGVHIIKSLKDIACYVYHASYLAKVKTAKNRKPSIRHSFNLKAAT